MVELEVDGRTHTVRDDGTLLDALREDVGATCVKDGCAPQGHCGACTVLVDGSPKLSCVTRLGRVAGKSVTTPEGLADPLRTRLAASIERTGSYDCGFCTPGILVRLHAFLSGWSSPEPPARQQLGRALGPHLCRCTGWQPIVDAVGAVFDADGPEGTPTVEVPGEAADPAGVAVALGRRRFLADDALMDEIGWWAVPVVAGAAHGAYRGITASSGPEDGSPDGMRVLTAGDLRRTGGSTVPVLEEGDEIRDAGDVVAIVVARSLSAARARAGAVRVLVDGAPDASVAEEAGTWLTAAVDPGFLETETVTAVASPGSGATGGALRVRSQSETPAETIAALEAAFPDRVVEVEIVSWGGSYGGKATRGPEVLAASAALAIGDEVCLTFGRRESTMWHLRRHPVKVECDLDVAGGVLRRVDGRLTMRGGSADLGPSPYAVPVAVTVDVVPGRRGGRLRADGLLQWTYVLEQEIDRLEVERATALYADLANCLQAVRGRDGVAIAGGTHLGVAAGVDLGAAGEVVSVRLAYTGAPDRHDVRNLVVSGAFQGLGTALSEEVPLRAGTPAPATMRSLGLLRAGDTPPIEARAVGDGRDARDTCATAIDALALASVPPAVANAVRARFGINGFGLPMAGSPPARAVRRR